MDVAATTAGWLSFMVTAIGLGSLITQTSAIEERLDPFHTSRSAEHLGGWKLRQPKGRWYQLAKPTPVGPVIFAKLVDGFCGLNVIGVSRLPLEAPGKATWTAVLAIFHEQAPLATHRTDIKTKHQDVSVSIEEKDVCTIDIDPELSLRHENRSWTSLSTSPLTRYNSTTCIVISRTTLITMLALCNGRTMYRYSDASGHRAAYGSYCGHWYIEWPLGAAATVHFAPHDSHSLSTDVYPLMFRVRVNKCIQIFAGVITSADTKTFQCAFPGRKSPGTWVLEYQRKGFPGAHGSRHLCNQMGGKVYEVDFLLARRLDGDTNADSLELHLPSTERDIQLSMFVPQFEQGILEQALDYLPWSSLSWSIHRGLRDILVAFAKPTMDKFRNTLALRLRLAISEQAQQLQAMGWAAEFVRGSMADLAANSVLAGRGNSGDSVRVVTDAATLLCPSDPYKFDETRFWRDEHHSLRQDSWLSADTVMALTKCFVLEWSNEFDYQMYHDIPPELLFY